MLLTICTQNILTGGWEETSGGDGYVFDLDSGVGFMGLYLTVNPLRVFLHVHYTSIKRFFF